MGRALDSRRRWSFSIGALLLLMAAASVVMAVARQSLDSATRLLLLTSPFFIGVAVLWMLIRGRLAVGGAFFAWHTVLLAALVAWALAFAGEGAFVILALVAIVDLPIAAMIISSNISDAATVLGFFLGGGVMWFIVGLLIARPTRTARGPSETAAP